MPEVHYINLHMNKKVKKRHNDFLDIRITIDAALGNMLGTRTSIKFKLF